MAGLWWLGTCLATSHSAGTEPRTELVTLTFYDSAMVTGHVLDDGPS